MKKRISTGSKKDRWVAVSGGFDPLHVGHVQLFKKAKRLGDKLVVIINNDNWLITKKRFVFMPERERVELIKTIPFVDRVVLTNHRIEDEDKSVSKILRKIRPAVFANGGDRKYDNIPEDKVCTELNIQMKFGVGGDKIQSSSWMTTSATRNSVQTHRPWGSFFDWDGGDNWHLKTIKVKPDSRLSLQYHKHRRECWMLTEGEILATKGKNVKSLKKVRLKKGEPFFVDKREIHRMESKKGGTIVEIAFGKFDENDIVRVEDDYGRVQ